MTLAEAIAEGRVDPECLMCQAYFEAEAKGKHWFDVFQPNHKAMDNCKSGKYAHCTCDTCF